MEKTKKATTKNQHYVPQFYQRFFSADFHHKTIGAYVISKRKYIPSAPIKNQSSGDYFYSDNQKIEDSLSKIESLASDIIKKIQEDPHIALNNANRYTLYVFTFMQIGRTLDRTMLIDEAWEKMVKTMMKKYVRFEQETGEKKEVELLTDEIIDATEIKLNNSGLFSLGQHAMLINTCIDLCMKILVNSTEVPFITSDNPACMYSMFLERVGAGTYALGSRGLMFYLPLTPKFALLFYDPACYKVGKRKKPYVDLNHTEDADNLNRLSACYANETIYCLDKSITILKLEQLAECHDHFRPKDRAIPIESGRLHENSEIVGVITDSIYCRLHLNFIKELDKSKAITPNSYNPSCCYLREIAQYKDEIVSNTIDMHRNKKHPEQQRNKTSLIL